MRRSSIALALAGVACLLVAACGRPPGTDGLLLDDWAPLGAPGPFVPPVGECSVAAVVETVRASSLAAVDCTASHRLETVAVGTFTGASAELAAPPAVDSAQRRTAFAECDAAASRYVGAQWRTGRLRLSVATPSAEAWTGGARWFRCDLAELSRAEGGGEVVSRSGSLKGALTDASPLRLRCYQAKVTALTKSLSATDCDRPHNTEFVGIWPAADLGYPSRDRDWVPFYAGCLSQLARYVGVPNDANLRLRAGIVPLPGSPEQWRAGDHGVRCYLWSSDRTFTASLRGAGPAGLPIRTR